MISVDFETLSAYKGKTPIIKNGLPVNNYTISSRPVTFAQLEELYKNYKYSVPNGRHYKYEYFKALSADELKLSDLINGSNRNTAKEDLEMTLLTGILNKSLIWPNKSHWFWQSQKDKDFVLLRKWFEKGDVVS